MKQTVGASEWEVLAEGYKAVSGKKHHWSDCATSRAPAEKPGPCDCDFPAIGDWLPIECWCPETNAREILICGGTVLFDAETFPEEREFIGVTKVTRAHGGWLGGYGSEYDSQYWHQPKFFQPLPEPASVMSARSAETEGLSPQDASATGAAGDAQPLVGSPQ